MLDLIKGIARGSLIGHSRMLPHLDFSPYMHPSNSAKENAFRDSQFESVFGKNRFEVIKSTQDGAIVRDKVQNHIVVAIRQTHLGVSKAAVRDISNNVFGFLGIDKGYGNRLDSVMELVESGKVHASNTSGEFYICGHSLGGALARTCGILSQSDFFTVNAPVFKYFDDPCQQFSPILGGTFRSTNFLSLIYYLAW